MENDVIMKLFNLDKGEFGYAKRYKNRQILFMFLLFLFILSDVLVSILYFNTRKTWLIIIACVLSIPFARNFVNYLLIIKAKPLNDKEHKIADELSEKYGFIMAYDISVTDSEGLLFYPCLTVYNNNVIAYVNDLSSKEKKYTDYLKKCYQEGLKPRVAVVDSFEKFEKEIERLNPPKDAQRKQDLLIAKKLLTLGL